MEQKAAVRDKDGLTPKQALFARFYAADGNGAKAARDAGSPPKNSGIQAAKWLKNSRVIAKIEKERKRLEPKELMTADELRHRIEVRANLDMRRLVDSDGRRIPLKDLPEDIARAVSFKMTADGLDYDYNRDKAMEQAAKVKGLFSEKVELSGQDGGPLIIEWGGDK